jgi:putative transposase
MSHYRRCYVPGGSFFFTVVTDRRAPILGTDLARDLLRAAFRDCLQRWPPFRVDAMVMLDNLQAGRGMGAAGKAVNLGG